MRWPMELFDITPIGRVVNRFSKDVDTCDTTLPLNLRVAISQFFAVISYIPSHLSNFYKHFYSHFIWNT